MIRTLSLTLTALIAFAANSVLCRAALDAGALQGAPPDAAAFTAVRLISGAAMLSLLLATRTPLGPALRGAQPVSALALLAYAGLFSLAYLDLDAGIGALILFGAVQTSMFAGALMMGERPPAMRWVGAGCGLAGLGWLAAPGASAPPLMASLMMAGAGAAWGVYSLRGRGSSRPLADTAGAFALAAPLAAILWAIAWALDAAPGLGGREAALAVASGAFASGCGYAVWYAALPRLEASMAAVAQLAVPLIALAGGMAWLGEAPSPRFWTAAALILGGLGAATLAVRRRAA
ncbi:DMT family transporter [uncultured Albimonas sp.]|uniref:DMT family transporter n=1 Tax=uncultured Albimonas sp. TaxID=1331701 RepID=UPI0030EC26BE|tara:strand:+ start:6929 stop:7801 length:873 start_codon:yes stop_codon:yes gene_type:complete